MVMRGYWNGEAQTKDEFDFHMRLHAANRRHALFQGITGRGLHAALSVGSVAKEPKASKIGNYFGSVRNLSIIKHPQAAIRR